MDVFNIKFQVQESIPTLPILFTQQPTHFPFNLLLTQ